MKYTSTYNLTMTNPDYFELLQKNLEELLNGKIGFYKLQRTDIRTKPNKYIEFIKGFKNYHFCVNIPYAGKILNWEIIFDPEDIAELPDFDFNDYSFLPEPDVNYIAENIPSWDNWDLVNPKSMLNIFNDFLNLYKKVQIEKLVKQNKYFHIKNQYEDLIQSMNLSEDRIEVHIESKYDLDHLHEDATCVNFNVFLPIDFSDLPEYCQEELSELLNPGEDFASLNIQMRNLDNIQTKVFITLSPRAEQVLGKIKLEKFKNKEATLYNYAMEVQNLIEEQIKIISDQHRVKNVFMSALVDKFSNGIVEYDTIRFSKINFIYNDEDYSCLVSINIGSKFPEEKPKIQLHSLYCQLGRNCNMNVMVSYDANGSIEENLTHITNALQTEVESFKNHKH